MARVVAVDAGTTGVRSLVVDEGGAVLDLAYRELTQHFPRPGWVEHDPDEIFDAVGATLAEVCGRLSGPGSSVAAVGLTNQRETAVAWDRAGGPLGPAIVWQDRRTAGRCEELRRAGHLPAVRARTGLVLDPYFSATKFAWMLEDGGLAGRVPASRLALATVDSWVLWRLTGGPGRGVFVTDVSNASRTMLFDVIGLRWTEELCGLFGVDPAALPEVRPSSGRFGTVDAAAVGVPALDGVPVSGVAGDQQAALFGQCCFAPGTAKVTYGTGSFVLANVGDAFLAPPDGLVTTVAWDLGGRGGDGRGPVAYALEGSTFASGAAIQWLRDGLGIIAAAEDLGPLAGSVADSGGVTVVPALTGLGSPWWDPRARGTITGITRGAGRAQLARAVVEAIAFSVRDMTDAMADATGEPLRELRADGGASAMDLLLQLQADQSETPVARPRSVESTALGAATLAGLAEGVWGSLDELAGLWRPGAAFAPSAERGSADLAHAAWLRAVGRSRGWAPAG
ncbi:MAG: FGGY family carbohydrate kinase [Acidimicrobiales bacterium]